MKNYYGESLKVTEFKDQESMLKQNLDLGLDVLVLPKKNLFDVHGFTACEFLKSDELEDDWESDSLYESVENVLIELEF